MNYLEAIKYSNENDCKVRRKEWPKNEWRKFKYSGTVLDPDTFILIEFPNFKLYPKKKILVKDFPYYQYNWEKYELDFPNKEVWIESEAVIPTNNYSEVLKYFIRDDKRNT